MCGAATCAHRGGWSAGLGFPSPRRSIERNEAGRRVARQIRQNRVRSVQKAARCKSLSCVSHDGCSGVGARDAAAGPARQELSGSRPGQAEPGRKTRWADERGLLTCGLASPAGLRLLDARRSHASASPRRTAPHRAASLLLLFRPRDIPAFRCASRRTSPNKKEIASIGAKKEMQHHS